MFLTLKSNVSSFVLIFFTIYINLFKCGGFLEIGSLYRLMYISYTFNACTVRLYGWRRCKASNEQCLIDIYVWSMSFGLNVMSYLQIKMFWIVKPRSTFSWLFIEFKRNKSEENKLLRVRPLEFTQTTSRVSRNTSLQSSFKSCCQYEMRRSCLK